MSLLSYNALISYWSMPLVEVNMVIILNLLGSLCLGLVLGFERSYHGRAVGMRTYGLICLASTGLIVIVGYSQYWFSGIIQFLTKADVTRVIQGIVTGIGFLGAGVIIKEGFTISGLTTAASIWSASAIGILVGIGFYFAAILLTILSALLMMWGSKIEDCLPFRHVMLLRLDFIKNFEPDNADLKLILLQCDYLINEGTIAISSTNTTQKWTFTIIPIKKSPKYDITELSKILGKLNGIKGYQVGFMKN